MHDDLSLMTLGIAIVDTIAAALIMFIACELGQRASNAFDEILDEFDKFNWYRFPSEISRLLPMILTVVQRPVVLEIFGNISLCRDVLKSVSSDAYKI